MRAKSESSESDGSQQSTPRNKKSGKHASKRHHRGDHKSSKRDRREDSVEIKKEAAEVAESGKDTKIRKRSRSRSASREKDVKKYCCYRSVFGTNYFGYVYS